MEANAEEYQFSRLHEYIPANKGPFSRKRAE